MLPIELTKILYDSWEGEISISSQDSQIYGKCLNGPAKVVFKNGNRYEGNFFNGLLNGQGRFTWSNGIVYQGQFTDNRITGRGIYTWPDGSIYEGDVKDGLRHGYGKYTIDEATYEGDWVEGKKEGQGKIVFKSGSIFEGGFKNDLKEGHGKMYYYPSGNFFQGQWKADVKEGMGTMNWTDIREKYVGQWKNNEQEGWGVHIWLQSKGQGKYMRNRYEGNWAKGVREGFGVFYYANGSKYEGYWKDNMKQGFAFYTNQNGKTSLILFNKDRMIKSERPSVMEAQNTKKLPNKKEVEPNYYSLCLNLDNFFLPQIPNLQQLFNYLLRNNTQLKTWYKGASTFYDQQSEYSFCLTLEGAWKMIRSLKVLGDFSLAQFNRGLQQTNADIKALLRMVQDRPEDSVNYEDIFYGYLGRSASRGWQLKDLNDLGGIGVEPPFRIEVVHEREKNILFRQFVQLLVWMAIHLELNPQKPQKSLQKLIAKITPFLDTISKASKVAGNDNQSDNKSSISKAQKNLTPFFRNTNSQLFTHLLQGRPNLVGRKDETLRVRELIGLGKFGGLGQAEWGLLEKVLEKYLDNEVLGREKGEQWEGSSLPLKVLNALEYELIEFEFTEIIYILLIKKLPNHKQNQENKRKYAQHLEELYKAKNKAVSQQKNTVDYKLEVRYFQSKKADQRERLRQRRRKMEERRAVAEARRQEVQREEVERENMQREDVDVKEVQFEEQQSQFQI